MTRNVRTGYSYCESTQVKTIVYRNATRQRDTVEFHPMLGQIKKVSAKYNRVQSNTVPPTSEKSPGNSIGWQVKCPVHARAQY